MCTHLQCCSYFNFRSSEIVSFLRPFLRRDANTARPLAVCIRFLKPCTVLRRRRCGWNVRFMILLLFLSAFSAWSGSGELFGNTIREKRTRFQFQPTGHHTHKLWKDGKGKWNGHSDQAWLGRNPFVIGTSSNYANDFLKTVVKRNAGWCKQRQTDSKDVVDSSFQWRHCELSLAMA